MGIKQNTATILAFTSFLSRFEATVTQITQELNEWKLYHFCAFSWFWVWPNTIYLGDMIFGWYKNIFDEGKNIFGWRQCKHIFVSWKTYICLVESIYLFRGKHIFVSWKAYICQLSPPCCSQVDASLKIHWGKFLRLPIAQFFTPSYCTIVRLRLSLNIGLEPVSNCSSGCQEYSWVGVTSPVKVRSLVSSIHI